VTAVPEQYYVDRPQRRNLNLAVACCIHGGIFIWEATGTDYHGYNPAKVYTKSPGSPYTNMSGAEYSDFITTFWAFFNQKPAFRAMRHHAVLVHDRYKVHTGRDACASLDRIGLEARPLPPRSPDLDPLDYGVFATSKTKERRERKPGATWEDRVSEFKRLINQSSFEHSIQQFPLRLTACIKAGGKHIDEALREVKQEASLKC
jgi:hypothetical protein